MPSMRLAGVTKLSQLEIDVDKDWAAKNIINFGPGGVDLYSLLTAHASRHLAGGADALSGIARSQLEYPTVNVSFIYLAAINKIQLVGATVVSTGMVLTVDSFADRAVRTLASANPRVRPCIGRASPTSQNNYTNYIYTDASAADHFMGKYVAGVWTSLATESVDLNNNHSYHMKLSCLGSAIKSFREDMVTPRLSVTDTSIASGCFGLGACGDTGGFYAWPFAFLEAASSPAPRVLGFYEVPIVGSGTMEDPFRAQLPELLEVPTSAELDAYPTELKAAIRANVGGKVNRLAVSHSALIPTDPTTGKPLYTTCLVRVFEQPDRQPHLWKIPEVLARLETQTAIPIRKLDVTQAIRRAKEMDPKLSDFDFYTFKSPSDAEVKRYVEWRKATFGVETSPEDAKRYLESDKGWT